MKRLRRWLFNFAAAVSLVTCIAATILWVRSYWRIDWARHYFSQDYSLALLSVHGRTSLIAERNGPLPEPWQVYAHDPLHDAPLERRGRNAAIAKDLEWGGIAGFNVLLWETWGRRGGIRPHYLFHPRTYSPLQLPPGTPRGQTLFIVAPHWLLIMLTIPLPALWLATRRRRQRQPGLCQVCGYDLRATPERCPECGAIPAAAKRAASQR